MGGKLRIGIIKTSSLTCYKLALMQSLVQPSASLMTCVASSLQAKTFLYYVLSSPLKPVLPSLWAPVNTLSTSGNVNKSVRDQPAHWDPVTLTFTPEGNSSSSINLPLNVFGVGNPCKFPTDAGTSCRELTVLTTEPPCYTGWMPKKGENCF